MFPWIPFLSEIDEDDGDLSKFILQAEFDGRLKHDEGFKSTTGDLCTLTAAASKDLYLTAAKVVFFTNAKTSNGDFSNEVVLKVNGTIVETGTASLVATTSGAGGADGGGTSVFTYEFKNIGHKVDATQVLKLEVISIGSTVDVEGFIQAIEVPDTENPVTYTGS